jgi:peroxiredoxin
MTTRIGRLFAVAMLALLTCGTMLAQNPMAPEGVKVGDNAPDFVLKNIDGTVVGPRTYSAAKGLILVFTCNHCPYSVKYEDRIIALHKEFAAKGFPVIAVNPNDSIVSPEDSYSKMQKRAADKAFPFAYLYDETQVVAQRYGARRTPHVFVLLRTRIGWTVEYIGAIDDNADNAADATQFFVADAVNALLKGPKPAQATTKAIGCTIKWKKG